MSRHSNIPEMKWAAIYLTGPRVRQTYFAPIENMFGVMKGILFQRKAEITTKDALQRVIEDIFCNDPRIVRTI